MMAQKQTASNSDQSTRKQVRKKDNIPPFVFDYIPSVDETQLAKLFDQLRVETK